MPKLKRRDLYPPRKLGPPVRFPQYSRALAKYILGEMATGRALRQICKEEGMPSDAQVRQWAIEDFDGFAVKYYRAREAQMEAWGEDIIEIADDRSGDVTVLPDGSEVVNHDNIARSKLRVHARQWIMGKYAARFADRGGGAVVALGGASGGTVQAELTVRFVDVAAAALPAASASPKANGGQVLDLTAVRDDDEDDEAA